MNIVVFNTIISPLNDDIKCTLEMIRPVDILFMI